MSKFVLKNIEAIAGKQAFKQVVVLKDLENDEKIQLEINKAEREGRETDVQGVLDEYEDSLETKYLSSFRGIIAIMNGVANLQPASKDKFRDITPTGETVKEYEFKFQDLRVYAIKTFGGQLVLLCGYKNQQRSDFAEFRALKKAYLNFLKFKK